MKILVNGRLDLKLLGKQAEQKLKAGLYLRGSIRETPLFNMKLLYSVFLPD